MLWESVQPLLLLICFLADYLNQLGFIEEVVFWSFFHTYSGLVWDWLDMYI